MLEFHLQDLIFLLAAGFIGAFIDAAVGGGGLITLPAFMATGIPTPFALGSNKLSSSIGAVSSFFTFAREGKVDRKILKMMPLSFFGSAAGACIASLMPEQLLRYIVVIALVCVALYTYRKKDWGGVNSMETMTRSMAVGIAVMAWCLGMYDGFFGPGTGSFLIFGFLYFGYNFVTAAGNTKALNLASNLGGLVAFLLLGRVYLAYALPMGLVEIAGAHLGAKIAIKKGVGYIRTLYLIVTVVLIGKQVYDLFLK